MELKDRYEGYEKANRITHYADEETAERLRCELGEEYTTFPPPATKEKAWEKLKEYTSLIHLESLIKEFKRNFPINLRTLNDELAELQKFIDEAETYSTVDAFKSKDEFFHQRQHQYEYLKLKYDYYKNAEYKEFHFFNANAEYVYGKYFVYKNWLEERVRELTPKQPKQTNQLSHYEQLKRDFATAPITIFETIKRELNSYHWIFLSQFRGKSTEMSLPLIHNDGRYCPIIHIHSNRELNLIENYKSHYTKRFEKGKKITAVENELFEIYKKAVVVRNYFNDNLTNKNPIIFQIAESFKTDYSKEHRDQHTMEVAIDNFNVQDIVFENDSMNQYESEWLRREFNYTVTNPEIAQKCQDLLNYIDNFEIEKIVKLDANPEYKEVSENTSKNSKNLHNHIFKSNAFEVFEAYKEKKSITVQSRTDLRVIYELLKADNLLVDTVELKHYIKWLNENYFNGDLGTELKYQDLKSKNNIQRANEYNEIKASTLKQP